MKMNSKELQYFTAYYPNKPIIEPSMVERNRIIYDKMDDDISAEEMQNEWWAKNTDISLSKRQEKLIVLRDYLLEFGGEQVCLPRDEEDLNKIMDFGQLWYGDIAILKQGLPNACHRNAARLWEIENDIFIATGYALSEDGIWRQHSWCVKSSAEKPIIIETTTLRVAYFGFIMTYDESEEFAYYNV